MFREDFNYDERFHLVTETEKHYISTVDLGINCNLGEGKPLYYETMIFPLKNGRVDYWTELYCKRYSTEEEAKRGHEEAIKYAKANLE